MLRRPWVRRLAHDPGRLAGASPWIAAERTVATATHGGVLTVTVTAVFE